MGEVSDVEIDVIMDALRYVAEYSEGRIGFVDCYLDDDTLDVPGNRAISFSPKIAYGLYEVVDARSGQLGKGR